MTSIINVVFHLSPFISQDVSHFLRTGHQPSFQQPLFVIISIDPRGIHCLFFFLQLGLVFSMTVLCHSTPYGALLAADRLVMHSSYLHLLHPL